MSATRTTLTRWRLTALAAALVLAACGTREPPAADDLSVDVRTAIAELETAIDAAERQLDRLRSVEELDNLRAAYGHYVDKSRHHDVADLFSSDGVVEILGRGVFIGPERVRQYMLNLGPVSQQPGALFIHMHLQPVITIADDDDTAYARSRLVVMFGVHEASAQWGNGVYENVLVREDGRWKFQYLHAYQTFYTGYEQGWANWSSPIFAPYDRLPPDRPQSVPYDPYPAAFVPPFHYPNPVSGRADHQGDPHWQDTR
jgi:hypothetical protein